VPVPVGTGTAVPSDLLTDLKVQHAMTPYRYWKYRYGSPVGCGAAAGNMYYHDAVYVSGVVADASATTPDTYEQR